MDDLIERLKAATEGCAELDMAIAVAVGRECETHVIRYQDGVSQRVPWRADRAGGTIPTPCYSRSLDAAITLVPPDCFYMVGTEFELPGYARLWRALVTVDDRSQRWGADAAIPALALCIAALMAREGE